MDENEEGVVSRYHVAEIIEARMEEILTMVEKELKRINKSALLPAGAVLTGGGACLPGVVDLAKNVLKLPAQTGFPIELSGLVDKVDNPSFSVAIGMILWAIEENFTERPQSMAKSIERPGQSHLKKSLEKVANKTRNLFNKFLP